MRVYYDRDADLNLIKNKKCFESKNSLPKSLSKSMSLKPLMFNNKVTKF